MGAPSWLMNMVRDSKFQSSPTLEGWALEYGDTYGYVAKTFQSSPTLEGWALGAVNGKSG